MNTIDKFEAHVRSIEKNGFVPPQAFGVGIRRAKHGKTLDVTFPLINFQSNTKSAAIFADVVGHYNKNNGFSVLSDKNRDQVYAHFAPFHKSLEDHANVRLLRTLAEAKKTDHPYADIDVIVYFLYESSQPVQDPEEAYFKLQCLSQRHVKPHDVNLNGAFGAMHNVAWTNKGPILPGDVEDIRIQSLFTSSPLQVSHIDKFPYLVDYHVPSGCRITSNSQVRLGAYLGKGTTIMPAGYVNFNAGTAGHAMVEGRISGGVFVGEHSDIGGGASIMGSLSGGNKNVISIGEKCLLGANAGTGISLGFGCTIQAGLYVTGGLKVSLYGKDNQPIDLNGHPVKEGQNVVKAIDLNGRDHMLFLHDSQTGKVICKPNPKTIELNPELHENNE